MGNIELKNIMSHVDEFAEEIHQTCFSYRDSLEEAKERASRLLERFVSEPTRLSVGFKKKQDYSFEQLCNEYNMIDIFYVGGMVGQTRYVLYNK